jgi:hypothetical protein
MRRLATVAEMSLREITRRRAVLVLLLLLPLTFYLTRRTSHPGQSIRFVTLGLAWAMSAAALFVGSGARGIDPRLRLSGYRSYHLYLGRLVALWALGGLVGLPYLVLVMADQGDVRHPAVAVGMALTLATAAPLGLLIGTLMPRELEGTLVLLLVVGLQMMADPSGTVAKALPFWASREIGTYAVDHAGADYLQRGVTHGLVTTVLLVALLAGWSELRLRRRPHLRLHAAR